MSAEGSGGGYLPDPRGRWCLIGALQNPPLWNQQDGQPTGTIGRRGERHRNLSSLGTSVVLEPGGMKQGDGQRGRVREVE